MCMHASSKDKITQMRVECELFIMDLGSSTGPPEAAGEDDDAGQEGDKEKERVGHRDADTPDELKTSELVSYRRARVTKLGKEGTLLTDESPLAIFQGGESVEARRELRAIQDSWDDCL